MKINCSCTVWLGLIFIEKYLVSATSDEEIVQPFPDEFITRLCNITYQTKPDVIRVFHNANYISANVPNLLQNLNVNYEGPLLEIRDFSYELQQLREIGKNNVLRSVNVILLRNNIKLVVENGLRIVRKTMEKKHLNKYIMLIETVVLSEVNWLEKLFETFWGKRIVNIIVMYHLDERTNIFTYRPFTEHGLQITNITDLDDNSLYAEKLHNFHRYNITSSMNNVLNLAEIVNGSDGVSFKGADANVAELLAERMNFTLLYKEPELIFNGSHHTGVTGEIVYDRANVSFNTKLMDPALKYDRRLIEPTNSFNWLILGVIVPKAGDHPMLLNLFKAFTYDVWIVIIAAIICVILVFKCMQKAQHLMSKRKSMYNFPHVPFMFYKSFLGDKIYAKIPTANSLRCILGCWFLYSFVITSTFTCKLKSSLVMPESLPDINTMDELLHSDLKIVVFQRNVEFIRGSSPELWQKMQPRIINGSFEHFEEQIRKNKNYAHIVHKYLMSYALSNTFNTVTSRPTYHEMREPVIVSAQVYLAEMGSPFLQRINYLLGLMHQAGLYVHWMEEKLFENALNNRFDGKDMQTKLMELEDDEIKIVMTIEHLQMAFYLLALGAVCSAFLFLAEIGWSIHSRKRTAQKDLF